MLRSLMLKWLIMSVTVTAILNWPCTAISRDLLTGAEENSPHVTMVILPFEIHAQKELGELEHQLPSMLAQQLRKENVDIVSYEAVLEKLVEAAGTQQPPGFKNGQPISPADFLEALKHSTRSLPIDYVLWGSLTQIGNAISLDARLLRSPGTAVSDVFYAEGSGLESLLSVVGEMSLDLSMVLFKREKIDRIRVAGNHRIEADAILRVMKTKPNSLYRPGDLSEDLKRVFKMGYFEDVRIESEKGAKGQIIIFRVKEKPTLRKIHIKGNRIFETEEIQNNMTLRTGAILKEDSIRSSSKRIEDLYKDKNYYNVKVVHRVVPYDTNQSDVEFVITEGDKIRILDIVFEGLAEYSPKDLKKIMKTSERGFFSWLTSSGELNMEDLNQDVTRIKAFYQNNGYMDVRVGDPVVDFEKEGIHITIKIDEGPQFKIGQVDVNGDLIFSKEELLAKTGIVKEKMFNREVIRNDLLVLTDLYSDEGYAKAEIYPRVQKKTETLEVDVNYVINKGKPIYFERIMISGNTKTRDKVIRRQLKVYEQELYSGRLLKRSTQNLLRLDYFEDVKATPLPGSADDRMNLKIDVTEKPTGTFSFGGGYSSIENFFIVGNISQRNLFGRGQTLGLNAFLGGETQRFGISFLEPWLFDIPLSAYSEIYNWDREYDDYDKDSYGIKVRFGYPVYDYTRAYLGYSYENANINEIEEDAANSIKELEGNNITSSFTLSLTYDSRDKTFHTTRGFQHSVSLEYAGGPLGGDIAFTKYRVESGGYFPLFWDTVFHVKGEAGYVQKNSGGLLPDYEKFYLGGINSLRGYDSEDVCAKDDEGDDIGGDKMVLFNVEFIFPLLKEAGLKGVLFFDTGDVYDIGEDLDFGSLRQTAGYGIRWNSPMGPFRLVYGKILDNEDEENDGGRWEFSIGATF